MPVRSCISFYEITAGTDDDLPPSHQNRVPRGSQVAGNERSAVGSVSFSRMHTDMEAQIHRLEQEAYCAVLRAFQAQSDALTWVFFFFLNLPLHVFYLDANQITCSVTCLSIQEKESLITELRNELRVSNDEHRELLTRVNADDIIVKLRSVCSCHETVAVIGNCDNIARFCYFTVDM